MRLVPNRDIQEPDLAHIESPFFACSKIRRFLLGSSRPQEIFGISNFTSPALGFDYRRQPEKLLREIEEGSWFLVIQFGASPFQPAARWQPAESIVGIGRWVADESLQPCARFKLEHVIARIEREKHRAQPQLKSQIIPISGTAGAGILKRGANFVTGHQAFPEHLTAADEKGWGSKLRSVYGGNDTIQNQADITAYNNTPSALAVTHGQIFDAMENVVTVAGLLEGGLALSRLKDARKIVEAVSSGSHNQANIASTTSWTSTATSSVNRIKLSNQLLAEEISAGHAFERHVAGEAHSINEFAEFGVHTKEEFAKFVEDILVNPSDIRAYSNGRSAILHEETGTVIIKNSTVGESTAFRPKYDVGWDRYIKGLPNQKIQFDTLR